MELDAINPFEESSSAKWIWLSEENLNENFYYKRRTDNIFVYFRKTLLLDEKPVKAYISCTSRRFYKLFVNGNYIGRGPDYSDTHFQYFDTYDIGSFLRKGKNVVAFLCYNYGDHLLNSYGEHEGPSCLGQLEAPPGLIFSGSVETVSSNFVIYSDEDTKVLHPQAWLQDSLVINRWRRYGESYRVCPEEYEWNMTDFDDGRWPAAEVVGVYPDSNCRLLVAADIPKLSEYRVMPEKIKSLETFGATVENIDAILTSDKSFSVIYPGKPGDFPTVTIDMGREVVGYPGIIIRNMSNGAISFSYGESLDVQKVDHIFLCGSGAEHEFFHRRAFRYMKLTFYNFDDPIELESIYVNVTHYPLDKKGYFECSDSKLKEIWETAAYTEQLCRQSHYEDCPNREAYQYIGDIIIQQLAGYYAFGDVKLSRKFFRQTAAVQLDNGAIPLTGPQKTYTGTLADFCAEYIFIYMDYYSLTGDNEIIKEFFPVIKRVLEYFESLASTDGLIELSNEKNFWNCFIDWYPIDKRGEITAIQSLYYMALKIAIELGSIAGIESKRLLEYESMALRVRQAANAFLWDREKRLFTDCRANGEISDSWSMQSNFLAVFCGLADEEKAPVIKEWLKREGFKASIYNPFFNYFILKYMFENDMAEAAVSKLRSYWGGMLDRGATTFWEVFDEESSRNTVPYNYAPKEYIDDYVVSYCHGWSSSPVYFLMAEILGIKPGKPGFEEVVIRPAFCGLEWAKGCVPTERGDIEVSWKRIEEKVIKLEVSASSEIKVDFDLRDKDGSAFEVYLNGNYIKRSF